MLLAIIVAINYIQPNKWQFACGCNSAICFFLNQKMAIPFGSVMFHILLNYDLHIVNLNSFLFIYYNTNKTCTSLELQKHLIQTWVIIWASHFQTACYEVWQLQKTFRNIFGRWIITKSYLDEICRCKYWPNISTHFNLPLCHAYFETWHDNQYKFIPWCNDIFICWEAIKELSTRWIVTVWTTFHG